MATELEIKYAVNDLQLLDCILCDPLVLTRMDQPQYRNIQMETTYYDTEDGALSARKCTYRLRKENGVSVITLKTPGEGYARGEWAWEGEYLDEAPEKLAGLGAPEELVQLLREAEPVIVCGAKFTRITALLHLDGADCEICGDIGSLIGGGRQEPLCELELELKSGSEAVMLDYAHALAEKYRLSEERKSKFAARGRLRPRMGIEISGFHGIIGIRPRNSLMRQNTVFTTMRRFFYERGQKAESDHALRFL